MTTLATTPHRYFGEAQDNPVSLHKTYRDEVCVDVEDVAVVQHSVLRVIIALVIVLAAAVVLAFVLLINANGRLSDDNNFNKHQIDQLNNRVQQLESQLDTMKRG